MSKIRLYKQTTAPDTPGTNAVVVYFDSSGNLCAKRDDGTVQTMTGAGTLALGGFTLTVPATGTADLLGTAQTFTARKTFSAGLVSDYVTCTALSMSDNQVRPLSDWIGTNLGYGLLIIMDGSNGPTALYLSRGAAGTTEISDPAAKYTTAAGGASSINIYWSSGVQIENKTGGTISVYLIFLGV